MNRFYVLLLVALMAFVAVPLSAQDLGLQRISGNVGVIFPKDLDTGFMLGAAADMGELTNDLSLVPLVSYWTAGRDELGVSTTFSNIQIGADVQYYLKDFKGLYVGGGLSLNLLSVSWEAEAFGFQMKGDDSETKFGVTFLAGYELPIGNNTGFVNAKYNLISDFNTFAINVGMWFDMK